MAYEIYDFLTCPESSCDNSDVGLDYFFDGENIFLSFSCLTCGTGSLEDDLRWYVKCPNCDDESNDGVDKINAEINESGCVTFKCTKCDAEVSNYVRTRWDDSDKKPKFETLDYKIS